MYKTLNILILLLLISCNKYHIKKHITNEFEGIGSAICNDGDIYKAQKAARLRALSSLIIQIKTNVISINYLSSNGYNEDIIIESDAVIKKWKEIETWKKGNYYWSRIILNKNDYYEGIEEYIKDIKSKIYNNLKMAENGTIYNKLNFHKQALVLAQKLDNKTFYNVKIKTQQLLDTINIIPEFVCSVHTISCIDTKIYLYGKEDYSISIEWFLENNKFIGSMKIGLIKNELIKYGIVFPVIVAKTPINKTNVLDVDTKGVESSITSRFKINTLYFVVDNDIMVNAIQITDTNTLRRSKFFLRKKYNWDKYCLFNGIRRSGSMLSMFVLLEDKHPLHFIKTKFYNKLYGNLSNDISEIYFDDNFIYARNIVRLYYIEHNEWKHIDMVKNAPSTLTVLSSPTNAQVFINNKYVGQTPYYLSSLLEKPYAIICVKKQGFYISEYFVSLLNGDAITKNMILKAMPPAKYGTYLNPNSYYADDSTSVKALLKMINRVDKQIKLLNKKFKYNMNANIQELYLIKRDLDIYHKKIKERIYNQYFSIDNLDLSVYKNRGFQVNDTINRLVLNGSVIVDINKVNELRLNIKQCFFKLEYKKIDNKYYKLIKLMLLYNTEKYNIEGKFFIIKS